MNFSQRLAMFAAMALTGSHAIRMEAELNRDIERVAPPVRTVTDKRTKIENEIKRLQAKIDWYEEVQKYKPGSQDKIQNAREQISELEDMLKTVEVTVQYEDGTDQVLDIPGYLPLGEAVFELTGVRRNVSVLGDDANDALVGELGLEDGAVIMAELSQEDQFKREKELKMLDTVPINVRFNDGDIEICDVPKHLVLGEYLLRLTDRPYDLQWGQEDITGLSAEEIDLEENATIFAVQARSINELEDSFSEIHPIQRCGNFETEELRRAAHLHCILLEDRMELTVAERLFLWNMIRELVPDGCRSEARKMHECYLLAVNGGFEFTAEERLNGLHRIRELDPDFFEWLVFQGYHL